jgi:hypothetical protein
MLVGGDNITESLIRRLYEKDMDNMLSGQAIIAKAKEAVKEAKKMNGLMSVAIKEGVLQKVEGGEYGLPSGRSEDDFDLWLLKRVYNWEKYYGASGKQQFNCNTNKISSSNNNDSDIITADEDGDNSGKDGGDGNGKDGGEGDGDDGFVNPADNNDKIQIELPIPHDIFADNELNTSSIADDGSTGSDKDPPQNYLPKGWVLFKTRGPMSFPIENRLDFFSESLSGNKRNIKHGRDHERKEAAKEKARSRDYAFDDTSTSVSTREARGVSLVNRKFAVRATQKDAQLALQHMDSNHSLHRISSR